MWHSRPWRDRAGQNSQAWIDPEALGASRVLDTENAAAKGAEEPPVLSGHRRAQWREVAVNNITTRGGTGGHGGAAEGLAPRTAAPEGA